MGPIPFSPPYIDEAIIAAVADVLRSKWISTGPKTKLFEKELSAYTGCKATLCLNSATAGLEVMLRWYGVGPGDEVILPAYTYAATANVVMHCGAKPVLVDIGGDFNISVEEVRKAITPNTKVIMPVDFGGLPCDYTALNDLVHEDAIRKQFRAGHPNQEKLGRILILSDSAHSIGAVYQGKKAGALTDASVISFHAVKNLTTAEGGAICLNLPAPFDNEEIYKYLCILTLHGQTKDALAKTQPGQWKYDIIEPGYKFNMTDIAAVIGSIGLARYDSEIIPKRKLLTQVYHEVLGKQPWAILPETGNAGKESSYHLYAVRVKGLNEAMRDRVIQEMAQRQISVNVHFIPLPLLSFYKNAGYDIAHYPETYAHFEAEISLPLYFDLTEEQAAYVAAQFAEVVNETLPRRA